MGDDTVKWALIDTLRLLNGIPSFLGVHDEIERIAVTLGVDVAASRHAYVGSRIAEPVRPTLKLARK